MAKTPHHTMAKGEKKVSKPAPSPGVGWCGFLAGAAVAAIAIAAGLFHVYGHEGNAVSPHAQYVCPPHGGSCGRAAAPLLTPPPTAGNWWPTQKR